MVGYNPEEAVHLSSVEFALAGALSGFVTRTVIQPLDVIKIRFQLQVEPIESSNGSKYHGVRQAVVTIFKDEGWRALWKGHVPAQGLSVLYGIAQFTSFELLTKGIWRYFPETLSNNVRPVTHGLCGAVAGCIATVVIQPIDVIRTRFIAQGEPKTYKSMVEALTCIVQRDGWLGMYRGLGPAVVGIAPQMGIQFGLYNLFTSALKAADSALSFNITGPFGKMVCGASAGLLSKLAVYPFDVIKKRLQVQGFEYGRQGYGINRQYRGMTHCLVCLAREEKLRGLYKGLSPSMLKAALSAGLHFTVYEYVCLLLTFRHR